MTTTALTPEALLLEQARAVPGLRYIVDGLAQAEQDRDRLGVDVHLRGLRAVLVGQGRSGDEARALTAALYRAVKAETAQDGERR